MGRILFPIAVAVFFVTLIAWAATSPVDPNPARREPTTPAVGPGDVIMVELTGWYGEAEGPGFVFWSTQEERHRNGSDPDVPFGDVEPLLQVQPQRDQVPTEDEPTAAQRGFYTGRHVGEAFTTPRIPPEDAFGVWETQRTFNRTLATLSVVVTFGGPDVPWEALGFSNLTEYDEFWRNRAPGPLEPGAVYACDGQGRWDCRVLERDEAGDGTITVERLVDESDEYRLVPFLGFGASAPGFSGHVGVDVSEDGGTFDVTATPVSDSTFQLRSSAHPALPSGTYRVQVVEAAVFVADYSTVSLAPPALIGKHVWFDLVIVSVQEPSS